MVEPLGDYILEERQETMVSPRGNSPFLKVGHFIKPTISSTHLLPPLTKAQIFDARNTGLQVTFKGRQFPQQRWETWVNRLRPKYQNVWRSAGIYESILISTYKICPQDELVLALAERWCLDTNTFIFPWGESTVTLEDISILGGFSVSGDLISSSLSSYEMKTEEKLINAWRKITLTTGKREVGIHVWMDRFMYKKGLLEHEAFLAMWLSWFIFPLTHPKIGQFIFPIAVRLSRGTPIALAPAVLASIYRDLSLLKKAILSWSNEESLISDGVGKITLFAPLQFVQVWAWERFPTLRPTPNLIFDEKPRFAMWHKLKIRDMGDIRMALDSAGECFQWRPYCKFFDNSRFNKLYRKKEEWIMVESGIENEIEAYVKWVRPSELIGLACEEQYLPHRVARQFGFDQDIPDFVPRSNASHESVWSNYTRAIGDEKLYIPPRICEPSVTVRYSTWWDQEKFEDRIKSFVKKPRSKTRKRASRACCGLNYRGETEMNHLNVDQNNTENENLADIEVDHLAVDSNDDYLNTHSTGGEVDPLTMDENDDYLNTHLTGGEVDPLTMGENAYKPITHSSTVNNVEKKDSTSGEAAMPVLDLEPRISRLEKLVSMLKAKRPA